MGADIVKRAAGGDAEGNAGLLYGGNRCAYPRRGHARLKEILNCAVEIKNDQIKWGMLCHADTFCLAGLQHNGNQAIMPVIILAQRDIIGVRQERPGQSHDCFALVVADLQKNCPCRAEVAGRLLQQPCNRV